MPEVPLDELVKRTGDSFRRIRQDLERISNQLYSHSLKRNRGRNDKSGEREGQN